LQAKHLLRPTDRKRPKRAIKRRRIQGTTIPRST
jgi:hypothetical protein